MQIATPLQICMKWNKLTASRKSVSCPLSLNIKQLNIDQDAAAQPFILINYGCTAYLQSSSRFMSAKQYLNWGRVNMPNTRAGDAQEK